MTKEKLHKALEIDSRRGDIQLQIYWLKTTLPERLKRYEFRGGLPTWECTTNHNQKIIADVIAVYHKHCLPDLESQLAAVEKELDEL